MRHIAIHHPVRIAAVGKSAQQQQQSQQDLDHFELLLLMLRQNEKN